MSEYDRPQSEPMGIGLPTGKTPALGERQQHCPGALLRATRDDFAMMRRGGEVFASSVHDIPMDGYGDARVHCTRDVAEIRHHQYTKQDEAKTKVYAIYAAALCSSCSELEMLNRQQLQAARGGKAAE